MVMGLSGVQSGLQSDKRFTKSDDHEALVRFVNNKYETDRIGRHKVLLRIN